MVALIKGYVGRGPTSSRAYVEEEMITVLLSGTLTKVEKTLTESGSGDVVSTMRDNFDTVLCAEAVALVERESGRSVKAFITGHAIEPDFSVFSFVLDSAPAVDEREEEQEDPSPCDSPGLGPSEAEPVSAPTT